MKLLFIAPLPPPITGHSLASEILYNSLKADSSISLVNLSKSSLSQGINSFSRIAQVFKIFISIFKNRRADKIYFTISESFGGNLKDLVIYVLLFKRLNKIYIHLHGSSIRQLLWDRNKILFSINSFFIKQLGGIIVLGESHLNTFDNIIDKNKIHIVPNFAQDYIFSNETLIKEKFLSNSPLKIVFISNMVYEKGYMDLFDAFILFDRKDMIQIDFAGLFNNDKEREEFLGLIKPYPQIRYHGVVTGQQKKNLFNSAHVFCLPTYYSEGQPISIIEAYASGCIVVSPLKGGILDIFKERKNGFVIAKDYKTSLTEIFKKILLNSISDNQNIAIQNFILASSFFRERDYIDNIKNILGRN